MSQVLQEVGGRRLTSLPAHLPRLPPDRPAPKKLSGYVLSFLVCVVFPSLCIAGYFGFFASDQYVSEARFAVRTLSADIINPRDSARPASTSSTIASGLSASSDNAYMAAAFIRSRAAIEAVEKTLDLQAIFCRPGVDFTSRLKNKASAEETLAYWRRMISAYVDPPSGIVTLNVTAFRPQDAQALAQAVLQATEKVTNAVSQKARADILQQAQDEMTKAEQKLSLSLQNLRDFRQKSGVIDPKLQLEDLAHTLEDLREERFRRETDYKVALQQMSPSAPTLQSLKARLDQLDTQIATQKQRVAGGPEALSHILPTYEELAMRSSFAAKLYDLAAEGLERARLRAEAQMVYMTVFVPPALPQEATYPQRFVSSALLALALTILWGVFALLAALVADHRL